MALLPASCRSPISIGPSQDRSATYSVLFPIHLPSAPALFHKFVLHNVSHEHFIEDPIQSQKSAVLRLRLRLEAKRASAFSQFRTSGIRRSGRTLFEVTTLGLRISKLTGEYLVPIHDGGSIHVSNCRSSTSLWSASSHFAFRFALFFLANNHACTKSVTLLSRSSLTFSR